MDLGITLFAGEAEGRFEDLLRAADRRRAEAALQLHERSAGPGGRADAVPAGRRRGGATAGMRTSFDAGRGCPFSCSFCTIINVQGRKSRARNADDVERLVRANLAQGVHNFFITDDNLARNQNWEAIFDRLIHMREVEGVQICVVASRSTRCATRSAASSRRPRAPGSTACSSAWRTSTRTSLKDAQKGQNRITEYRAMLQAWHRVGALTYAGYILGFPGDTPALDRARHPHHPARAADRHPRVLHPHAAARAPRTTRSSTSRACRWSRT